MIAVMFELVTDGARRESYLELASALASQLTGMDGFIGIERFQSLHDPDKLLSLSFWRDELAVAKWRCIEEHRRAQALGRTRLFADYRLRVAHVVRDYGSSRRDQAPADALPELLSADSAGVGSADDDRCCTKRRLP